MKGKTKIPKTPMLEQFMKIKKAHPDSILFYRMGDFYEMFFDDAIAASEILGLRLTSRAHGKSAKVPLAGFPHHQLDSYLSKMVQAEHRVVVVEQVEDPKLAKGLVKRDVVRVATKGTNITENDASVSRIAALIKQGIRWGFAWADVSSGEFSTGEFSESELIRITGQISPVELLIPHPDGEVGPVPLGDSRPPMLSKVEQWIWESTFARQTLIDHFGSISLKGFGIDDLELAISAAGALLHYLKGNLRTEVSHLTSISRADVSNQMLIESATRRNMELTESLTGNHNATLFSVIDMTITIPGKRLLYSRLHSPLADIKRIEERLDSVEELTKDNELRSELRILLKKVGNLQTLLARLATGRASARDLANLRDTLTILPNFRIYLNNTNSALLQTYHGEMDELPDLLQLISESIVDDPPYSIRESGIIRDGYDNQVDEYRTIQSSGKSWMVNFEREERERTGIARLKIGFNRVFGYYIELTRSQLENIPENYIRRQTLASAERFFTAELKEYEEKLLGAEEKINFREQEIFIQIVSKVLKYSKTLQENATILANLDFLSSLAELAVTENYIRPILNSGNDILLENSRHPVVEKLLPAGEQFIPNDLEISENGGRIHIITGPNMAGKSTYLRQVALIVILAQMGSFVPASSAEIGIVDKLFTRIGALDNLAGGESTFLIEMQETSSILHNSTSASLVLIDEVGRGTSTFDGLSIAWAIVEHLHNAKNMLPRTLFATHFHEMVELSRMCKHVINKNVAIREFDDKIVFLRKIIDGGADRSFGIHVAQMAGLPAEVISRARAVLDNLEKDSLITTQAGINLSTSNSKNDSKIDTLARSQLSLFEQEEEMLREIILNIDPNSMTPLAAISLLSELKDKIRK